MNHYQTTYNSPLGKLTLLSNGISLEAIVFKKNTCGLIQVDKPLDIFKETKHWLDLYFSGKNPSPKDLNIKLEGNNFQKNVWQLVSQIPYGQTSTYKDIALKTALLLKKEKMSYQAVGRAIGQNPIPIIIPCHRVIGSNGKLIGYSGGIENKIKLLKIERIL